MLNVSSPSPLYDENSVENSNKKNVSMLNSNNPSSRPTLYNGNTSSQNISNEDNNIKYTYEFKIILLGSVAVGKTAILSKYMTNNINETHTTTIQATFKSRIVNVNNATYAKLNIWDTCGSEKFRAITMQYYKEVNGIILVYDISNRNSFDNIDSWVDDINNFAPEKCVVILVANKTDLADQRVVSFQEGKNKADKYGFLFYEVSAKLGDNILLIFGNISEAMLEQQEKSKIEPVVEKQSSKYLENIELNNKREVVVKERKCC
jgi:small GTP-binding protein